MTKSLFLRWIQKDVIYGTESIETAEESLQIDETVILPLPIQGWSGKIASLQSDSVKHVGQPLRRPTHQYSMKLKSAEKLAYVATSLRRDLPTLLQVCGETWLRGYKPTERLGYDAFKSLASELIELSCNLSIGVENQAKLSHN